MEKLKLKTINEIETGLHFFVPSYQRGYRWDRQQVENLLNDLYEFMNDKNNGIQDGQFYCLQPIVVRKREENDFEVIDGQQRLTTISILLQFLNLSTFTVSYETRPKSKRILASIPKYATEEAQDVDHHYFKETYITIQEWFRCRQEEPIVSQLHDMLMQHTKVIWYEVAETANVHELFMRLNIGKIPLTNAELIKASLLQPLKENVRQEFALHWEQIERALRDDSFWYFIKSPIVYTNRIEYLFDLIVGKSPTEIDPFYTFYQLEKAPQVWERTQALFALLQEWYVNHETYHLVGCLLHTKKKSLSLKKLYQDYESEHGETKEVFLTHLRQLARLTLPPTLDDIRSFRYNAHKREIQSVLLFFNILEETRSEHETNRFPFHHYALERWSLEHIHAQKTEALHNREQWKSWLKDVKKVVNQPDLVKQIDELLTDELTQEKFENLAFEIEKQLPNGLLLDESEIHGIGNMTLLGQHINSKLGNHYYPIKFEALKGYERSGGYVPPATRKVFWKYYSTQPDHFEYWSKTDQTDYTDAIINRLTEYFKEQTHVHI